MDGNQKEYSFAELKTDVEWIKKILTNHLAHHEKWLWWMLGAIGTIGVGLILNVLL